MKKLLVLAMTASLLMAGSAFAAGSKLQVAPNATFPFGAAGIASGPATTNNDDSCDISTAPAATLLLPFFDVDFKSPQTSARTTLFTITNVSRLPQIAHVVLWTDWSYAALDFNIFLTGYDVQSINLYDIFQRGVVAPITASTSGTSVTTPLPTLNGYLTPLANATGNPNFQIAGSGAVATACVGQLGQLPSNYIADLQSIFTTGVTGSAIGTGCSTRVGGTHADAIGYVTIDVANTCSTSLPSPGYFQNEILFDNVLIGDYQDVNPNTTTGNYAGGNPLVHIRAIPEGGRAGAANFPGTNLPYTFYDRYTQPALVNLGRTIDRRQPLPATFAARFIQGGTTGFSTNYKIWREGVTIGLPTVCSGGGVILNSALGIADLIRFDEHENATTPAGSIPVSPPPTINLSLPETSSTNTSSSLFPGLSASGDVSGWIYLNLNNASTPGFAGYSSPAAMNPAAHPTFVTRSSQNWVIIQMFAEGRYSVDFDSAWLGNGCSAPVAPGAVISPTGGTPVCPVPAPGLTEDCTGQAAYTGTNVTP
jgi:hypothetical protein